MHRCIHNNSLKHMGRVGKQPKQSDADVVSQLTILGEHDFSLPGK